VLELTTDGSPERVVAKLSAEVGNGGFDHEHRVLDWYRENTRFPVPRPFGCDTSGELFDGSCLMMERLPGENLGHVRLSARDRKAVEREMAEIVAALHERKRATYGSALEPAEDGAETWLERFGPRIRREFEAASPRLTPKARRSIGAMLDDLDEWLPESGDPTLVHGDLWATNIIVEPTAPRITGFVDGGANYCDVEYELAYLLVFNTVGNAFFEAYQAHHALRPGFRRRCRVYWLNTMMLHVRVFGDAHYVRSCERLAREVDELANA
jgi:fructosamine-3-kinase